MRPTAEELIAALHLQPHPMEGGFFRETYRSPEAFPATALPDRYGGPRSHNTAIYYFLTPTTFSALHRLRTDEVFHFYLGDPVRMLQLWPDGTSRTLLLGTDLLAGQQPQVVVPRGVWQGSFLAENGAVALMGTTMAPGFDFTDYEAGDRERLSVEYPDFVAFIHRLTREA